MHVVIAGGHGKIAKHLQERLLERGDTCLGLVRNPDHAGALASMGAESRVVDLEVSTADQVAELLRDADAVVFAAGAGPGSGAARKDTVDRGASVLLADAAQLAGVRRFVQLSAMGLERADQPGVDGVFAVYLRAKAAAERDLRNRDRLDWTVLRPGRLTEQPGTAMVALAPGGELDIGSGSVPRADVAAVLAALLRAPATAGRTLELLGGSRPVAEAVEAVSG